MDFYVYKYIDPRNNQIIYIGKGKGNRRFFHLNKVRNNPTMNNFKNYFLNTIKSILQSGMEPEIKIIENNMSQIDALLLEKQLIEAYGRKLFDKNGLLCNILIGNLVAGTVTKETREKISKIHKGRIYSKEQCLNISKAKTGKKNSVEHNESISKKVKDRWNNDLELREKHKQIKNDPLRNRSKVWLVEDSESNTIYEILNLTSWCREQGWNENDSQQLYRTLKNPSKHINNTYQSSGYRLIKSF